MERAGAALVRTITSINISREAIHSTKTSVQINLRNLPAELLRFFISSSIFKYFDEGMSQKDSRDDSKGPASTQKLNYLYLHFERGDSQHENIRTNKPSKPSCRAFEIFAAK